MMNQILMNLCPEDALTKAFWKQRNEDQYRTFTAAWFNTDNLESVKLKVHSLITKIKGFNRSLRQGNFRSRSLGYYNDTYYDVSKLEQERKEILDQFQSII